MPENPVLVESIVSTDMAKAIAKAYDVELVEVLTGFKYIGEQMLKYEKSGEKNYVFGFEESYGCLPGTYARDKDAPAAVCMLCEVAAFYKSQGKTLWDGMIDMYEKYGYYREGIATMTLKGIDGAAQIQLSSICDQKCILRNSQLLTFLFLFLLRQTFPLRIYSNSRHVGKLFHLKFLFCQLVVLMIDRYQHIRPSAQHLLHRIVHQPVHKRSPLVEMKSVRGINHLRFCPVPGDPCHHTTNRAVTVAKCVPILLHQTFHLPQCPGTSDVIDLAQCPHVLSHMLDIPCEINLVAAHMHILQFLLQFRDTLIRAGISFDKIAGHIYLVPQFLQQDNVWHIKLIDH